MKLILLHGNGQIAQLNKIAQLRQGFAGEITTLNNKEFKSSEILIQLRTADLFNPERLIIIENLENDFPIENLPVDDPNLTVVLKINKSLAANSVILKQVTALKGQVLLFTEVDEAPIFPYLDLLADKNSRALAELDYRIEEHGGQYLLTMFAYMLRRMVVVPNKLPDFALRKIRTQQKNFPIEKITTTYQAILETDFKIKNGLLEEKMGLTMLVEKIIS